MAKQLTIDELFPNTQTIHWHAVERADRSMRRAGRARWNDADRAVYLAEYYRVFAMVAGSDHPAVVEYKRHY